MVEESKLEFLKPWKCEGPCGALMYNKTPDGYPSPGAPVGFHVKSNGKDLRVCSLCADMWITIAENEYMCESHKEWAAKQDALKPGGNYLSH